MIRIQVDEYENLINEIESLHEESISFVKEYINEINGMLEKEGGFHADMISSKINIILDMFQEKIIPELENNFANTDKEILTFAEKLAEADVEGRGKVQWEE